jgi:non-haem Fe2+, alpha-ketoglutarate-dependent halogenase
MTDALRQTFQKQGFVGPINVLSREEAAEALRAFNQWAASTLPNGLVAGDLRFKPHLHLDFINAIVRHPALVQLVKTLLQTEDVLLWSSDFNIKPPESPLYVPPHQDATYAGLHPPDRVLTVWIALSDPVGIGEGCLSFSPGSQLLGQLPHVEHHHDDDDDGFNLLSRNQRILAAAYAGESIPIPLRGGQATAHHFYGVHSSGPNQSKRPRIGLACRYMAASVTQAGQVKETVTWISGNVLHDGFELEPILPEDPTKEELERGREAHAEAVRREAANYFQSAKDTSGYDERLVPDTK